LGGGGGGEPAQPKKSNKGKKRETEPCGDRKFRGVTRLSAKVRRKRRTKAGEGRKFERSPGKKKKGVGGESLLNPGLYPSPSHRKQRWGIKTKKKGTQRNRRHNTEPVES